MTELVLLHNANELSPIVDPNSTLYGWKLLGQYGETVWMNNVTHYPLPPADGSWGEWMQHPDPAITTGASCGAGGYHIMRTKMPSAVHVKTTNTVPYFAQIKGVIGMSYNKARGTSIRLRRIKPGLLGYMMRRGWGSKTCFDGMLFEYESFDGSRLSHSSNVCTTLRNVDITHAAWFYSFFRLSTLRTVSFDNSILARIEFDYCLLDLVSFVDASLHNVRFNNCKFDESTLTSLMKDGNMGVQLFNCVVVDKNGNITREVDNV